MKKALVTGGAGFIGSHIVEELVKLNYEVSVIDNLTSGKMTNIPIDIIDSVNFIVGDIRETSALKEIMKGCDVVFHQAAVVSVPETFENPIKCSLVNDIGFLYVLQTARELDVERVVYASSCAVYNNETNLPLDEEMETSPISPYAITKLTGEYYASLYKSYFDLEVVGLRYFNVYGPRQDDKSEYSGVISKFLSCAINNKGPVIYGSGEQYRDFIYVKDVVRANIEAANANNFRGETFNIGTGKLTTINSLWRLIQAITGTNIEPKYYPERVGDIFASVANTSYCESVLGFKYEYELSKGIIETLNWYRSR